MLMNSTDLNKILCNFGIKNISECEVELEPSPEHKDINQTVRIVLYSLIFLLSVLGNSLIIAVLVRNRRMRTVTNLFLLSLAVSDLMVSLVCVPFTLIPNLMRDFVFGTGMCKLVMYFMGVSVSISTFNLVAISLERYSAICNPLTSRAWQTKSHAAKVITATWVASFILMLPYPISSALKPFTRLNNSTGHMCRLVWPNDIIQQSWYVSLLLLLFLIPGIVMMTAYGLISMELYRGIRFELSSRKSSRGVSVSISTFNLVAISLERYSAICNPLTSRAWQTKSHAAKVITATWVASFILMLPYPISSALKPFTRLNNSTGHMCRLVWPNDIIQQSWYVSLLLLLFLIPGIVMMTAYGLISMELYRGIRFELSSRKSSRGEEVRHSK
ncbi:Cholecystokinin type 1 receptor [Scophthalmus maximus]|uniref:Gastrin/cholecystokinin type B receptor n=1 Tax=Scophthalmus maximus TaxID=52904 RepID=A0A2U9B158_SCOMX|nr:Cholecystokinin type 1 receptor [Scophthalmus maximus]